MLGGRLGRVVVWIVGETRDERGGWFVLWMCLYDR